MLKSELLNRLQEIIAVEDDFVERIAEMDLTTINHTNFKVTSFLRLKSGLMRLLDDSRRHREILSSMIKIISEDGRNEY